MRAVVSGLSAATRRLGADVAGVLAAKLAVGAWALAAGFSHISDDDYARVVIAQQLVHAPRLDPSGTSWLPLPFWAVAAAMGAFGRSIATARVVSVVFAALATAGVYLALRAASHPRGVALLAVALGLLVPLDAWVGVATVPEAYTGGFVAAAVLAVAAHDSRREARVVLGGASLLFAASLARYETWPACVAFAVCTGLAGLGGRGTEASADPSRRRADLTASAVALAGPALWMGWNLYAHGSATHFLDRVARYRVAIHAAPESLAARLLGYPRALFATSPAVALLGLLGAVALIALRGPALRRMALPLLTAAVTLAFLIYGDVKDGAPTHHPERALLGVLWIAAATGAVGIHAVHTHLRSCPPSRRVALSLALAGYVVAAVAALQAMRAVPGNDAASDRAEQVARGESLRASGARRIVVTPCAYEHFALIAAFGAPERVEIRAPDPDLRAREACPHVDVTSAP